MAKKVKRFVSLILSFVFLMCLIPIFALNPYKAYAADSDQSAYMKYETNYTQQGLDGSFGSYRIWGFINGPQVQTTYNNEGFRITLVENGQQHSVGVAQNGVEKFVADDLWITQNLSIVNNGRYVKVQFVVRNAGNTERTFSLGSGADVQIGTNDCAPITKFDNGSGFYMSDGSQAQFNFIGRGAYGVTDVDTFWYGVWNTVDANMFSPAPAGNLTNTDSGMAFSWQNRTIEPNSSEAFSVLIGIGPLNNPPVTTIDGLNTTLPDSVPGGTYTITGSVSDAENSTGTSIYYAVDDRAPIEAYTFNGAPGNFTATVNIPEDITPGSHTLSVYAQDVDGAISSAVTRTFNIPDTQPLIPDISAEYAGTNTSYTSNTPTNSNITFSTNDSGIECSTDGGNSFTAFSSPMTVSGAGTYIFRYAGVTNSSAYVTYVANINKAFQGNLSGVQDQGKYNIPVTPVFTNATAAIIKDNGTPEAFTSNTQITADGNYSLILTDQYGNTAAYSFMVDKTAPTISSVTGNPAEWTEGNVTLAVNASDGVSGLADAAYSFDGGTTWQTGNTKTYSINTDGIVIKVKDNAGNIATYGPFDITDIDKTLPNAAVIANSSSYTDSKWYNENQTITASFTGTPGCSEKLQYKVNDGSWTDGDSVLITDEGRHTVSFRVIDALDRTGQVQTVNVNIDKTRPVFSGANDNGGYYIGRVISLDDSFDEIETAIYKKDDGPEKQFVNGALFDEAGRYTLTIKDKAGNENTLSFVVKALPNPEDIVYTSDCKSLIENIAAEFNSHSDLPEPYKSNTENKIKALQNRYDQLGNEVKSIKSEVINIENKVNNLPGDIDGLISMQDKIQQEYDDITGRNSTLTAEQKSSLLEETGYLKEELNKIKELEYEVESIKAEVASIPTSEDGLIARQDYIKTILGNINKLTNEQQNILKDQIYFLNVLLSKIDNLQSEVKTVRDLIKSLPAPESVTKQDAGKIANANELYDKLNNEQKNLVGQELEGELNSVTEALRKLMLYDTTTDTTVTGIDGTSFSPDVYLVVTPINQTDNKTNFKAASDKVEQAVQKISELKNKELISLYDVSMFKGSTKIQPDGKVQVKIKIPDNLKGREELDIIHIADDGTVTSMHAVREGDYLTFVTDHFSKYGIIAKSNCRFGICKAFGIYNPIKGVCYDWLFIAAAVIVLAGTAYAVYKRKGEKQTKESAEADI